MIKLYEWRKNNRKTDYFNLSEIKKSYRYKEITNNNNKMSLIDWLNWNSIWPIYILRIDWSCINQYWWIFTVDWRSDIFIGLKHTKKWIKLILFEVNTRSHQAHKSPIEMKGIHLSCRHKHDNLFLCIHRCLCLTSAIDMIVLLNVLLQFEE